MQKMKQFIVASHGVLLEISKIVFLSKYI